MLSSKKELTALKSAISDAGLDVADFLAAEDGSNPITAAIMQASASAAADATTAAAAAVRAEIADYLDIELSDGETLEARIAADFERLTDLHSTADKQASLAAAGIKALGIDLSGAAYTEETIAEAVRTAVAAQTARQIAAAGHEPLPVPQGEPDVSAIDVMDIDTARAALAVEQDQRRIKQIYDRIQELKAHARN